MSNSGYNGDMDLSYIADATVLGIPCKKLEAIYTGAWGPASPILTQTFATYYTYQSNNVLFLYNSTNAVFDTIVNFNANIGDTWLRPGESQQPGGCNSRRAFTVTDTGHVIVNGFNLRTVKTVYTNTVNYGQGTVTTGHTDLFTERFLFSGSAYERLFFLFPTYCEVDFMIPELPYTTFRCYEDDGFPLYNPTNNGCKEFWTSASEPGHHAMRFTAYPNPANDVLTITLPASGIYEAQLSDLPGNSWPLGTAAGDRFEPCDISRFEPGIYFIRLYENGRQVGVEKIVKK